MHLLKTPEFQATSGSVYIIPGLSGFKRVSPKVYKILLLFALSLFFPTTKVWAGNNIVLLMDNSGSMRKNDPDYWSKSSAEFFVSRCKPTDRVSIIPFDSSLRRNKRLKFSNPVKNHRDIIKFIKDMDYKGPWTDFHWALKAAYDELKDREGNKYVILFTDGEPDPDPKDKLYSSDPGRKSSKNRKLSMKAVEELYAPAGIKLFTIAFTDKSDIDFLMAVSKEANGTYDFCFRVDQSYGISDIFLKISNYIPVLGNWFSSDIKIPPALAKSFILVDLNKNISQRNYIDQNILDGIDQLAQSAKHKGIPIAPYHWPQLAAIRNVKDVVRQLSRVQKYFVVLDFQDNGQTAEYYIYDFSSTRKTLYSHRKITLGILPELCGRIASEIFSDLKDFHAREEITIPVTVKDLVTKKPVVAEVTFVQGEDKFVEFTDAFGHAIFVGYDDEPFTITFASGGVKLGEWNLENYNPAKVFYLAAGYDIALKVQAIPYYYDDLDPQNKGQAPKEEVVAQIELDALGIKLNTPCVIKKVPIGLTKLNILKSMYFKKEMISIPSNTYLPYTKYINVSPDNVQSYRLEETITLDKNYLHNIREVIKGGEVKIAEERARRLINLHKEHPQVFEIISLISEVYISQGNFNQALKILAYFKNKYKDKYYYRQSLGLSKDRFLLSLKLAELRLIDYLLNPGDGQDDLLQNLGLADLRAGQRFFNQCQNSMAAGLKIANLKAQEFYLCYALASFKAYRLTEGKLGEDWNRYFARYKRMWNKNKLDLLNLNIPVLQDLLEEVEIAYKK